MEISWDPRKEASNVRKHGLSFSLADQILSDPLSATWYDRIEGGEHRYHTVGVVRGKMLLVVHTDPAARDGLPIRIIGLRAATNRERRRYEDSTD